MATSESGSADVGRISEMIKAAHEELLDAQEHPHGRVRDLMRVAELRARLFGLRSEKAMLEDDPGLAVVLADREKKFMHEARQLTKQVIADELEELRAYVLEGTELESSIEDFPEKLSCGPGQSGTGGESSSGSEAPSTAGSSTSS